MNQSAIAALLLFAGLIGGACFAILPRGRRVLIVWAIWLILPYVALAALLLNEADPTLDPARRAYDLQFGFGLYAILFSLPWLGANLVGWVMGVMLRRAPRAKGPPAPASPRASTRPREWNGLALPDWNQNDRHLFIEMQRRMAAIAERIGIGADKVPAYGTVTNDQGETEEILQEKFEMVYLVCAGERIVYEYCTVNIDQLLYRIFARHVTREAARQVPFDANGNAYTDALREAEHALLAKADPLWGNEYLYELAVRAATETARS